MNLTLAPGSLVRMDPDTAGTDPGRWLFCDAAVLCDSGSPVGTPDTYDAVPVELKEGPFIVLAVMETSPRPVRHAYLLLAPGGMGWSPTGFWQVVVSAR